MFNVTSILTGYRARYQLCTVSLVKAKNGTSNREFDAAFFAFGEEIFLDILKIIRLQNS